MQLVRDLIALVQATWAEWGELRLDGCSIRKCRPPGRSCIALDRPGGDLHGDPLVRQPQSRPPPDGAAGARQGLAAGRARRCRGTAR